jgi:hypothetical protein
MREARRANTFDDLLAFARAYNGDYMLPNLHDTEVVAAATSAWQIESRGENWFGGGGMVTCPHAMIDELAVNHQDALLLLMIARRYHWGRERFYLANGMAESIGWTLRRFTAARRHLEETGYIVVLHRGGNGPNDPTEYGWPKVSRQQRR